MARTIEAAGGPLASLRLLALALVLLAAGLPPAAAQDEAGATVWAWGANGSGQLGAAGAGSRSTPAPVRGLDHVIALAAGAYHSLALRADGTVWAWGNNIVGQLGLPTSEPCPADPTVACSTRPLQVPGLREVVAVAGGGAHSLALTRDGTVWAWGDNTYGQLGNGSFDSSTAPVPVRGLTGVTAIAAGYFHSLALRADGTLWSWGSNAYGELGNDTLEDSNLPVQVMGLSGVVDLAGGFRHSLALTRDGTVWAWGDGEQGQLGSGLRSLSPVPVRVPGLAGVVAIASGYFYGLAVRSDGTVWAWGDNCAGQLGNGSRTRLGIECVFSPVRVSALRGATSVRGGLEHTLALSRAAEEEPGQVWAWGANQHGQLGVASNDSCGWRAVPCSIAPAAVSLPGEVRMIAAGEVHSLALVEPPHPPAPSPTGGEGEE